MFLYWHGIFSALGRFKEPSVLQVGAKKCRLRQQQSGDGGESSCTSSARPTPTRYVTQQVLTLVLRTPSAFLWNMFQEQGKQIVLSQNCSPGTTALQEVTGYLGCVPCLGAANSFHCCNPNPPPPHTHTTDSQAEANHKEVANQ